MTDNTQTTSEESKVACIDRLLQSGLSFALYRMPDTDEVQLMMQTEGDAQVLDATETEPQGYVIAPFTECKTHPTLIIRPDVYATGWEQIVACTQGLPRKGRVSLDKLPVRTDGANSPTDSWMYKERFEQAIRQIMTERFEKVVISYCQEMYYRLQGNEANVYLLALENFPHSFVHMFYTPTSGRWMGCSPELLLHRCGNEWQTMALAGTHAFGDGTWDTKNVHEQDVVSRYIQSTLAGMGAEVTRTPPYTAQAGKLLHLRTDFNFTFDAPVGTMDVARCLHPTPAVCGMPKEDTLRYLSKCERVSRNYYTGYIGPVNHQGHTHLYVNLRCVQIRSKASLFYAGGGITALSLLWEERQELERKLNSLKDLIYP